MTEGVRVLPVLGLPEIAEGDDLAALIAGAAALEDGDVLVVAQKAVSKAEGRVVVLDDLEPSAQALEIAAGEERDARHIEAILRESARLVRVRAGFVIAETRHGFVCGSAGVDASNAPGAGMLVLLPLDPDASAARLRERLRELAGVTRRRDRLRFLRPRVAPRHDGHRDRRRGDHAAPRPDAGSSTAPATSCTRPRSPSPTRSPAPPSS